MAALKHKNNNHTPKTNAIKGEQWLNLKVLLSFGCFWQMVNHHD